MFITSGTTKENQVSSDVQDESRAHPPAAHGWRVWRGWPRSEKLANRLTLGRIALSPVLVMVLAAWFSPPGRLGALAIFAVGALTDFIDGDYARYHKCVSDFGRLADPIADKLMVIAVLAMLATHGLLPWLAVGLIAAREVAVTIWRLWLKATNGATHAADRGGKLKMALQCTVIVVYLAPLPAWSGLGLVRQTGLWLAVVVTVATGLHYWAQVWWPHWDGRVWPKRTGAGGA